MNRAIILAILLTNTLPAFSQSYWKIENEYGDEILLTIHLNNEKKTFEAHTRKDALKDIAGSLMYVVAKTAGKLKYPEIVYISGNSRYVKDSTLLTGTFYYFDKQYDFSAGFSGNGFKGRYLDSKKRPRQLTGKRLPDSKPLKDYRVIIYSVFAHAEKNIVDKDLMKSDDWLDFKKNMLELSTRISDDYELAACTWWLGKKLPFAPFEISKINPYKKVEVIKPAAAVREVKHNTILFDKNILPLRQRDMDSLSMVIAEKKYTKLIVDLRGSKRLDPQAAGLLLNYLSAKSYDAGAYITRKWLDSHGLASAAPEYKASLKGFSEPGYSFGALYKEPGRNLNIVPMKKTFMGTVYVLTDSKTSQASEMLAYALKRERAATIVGQKTAGSWYLVENIRINTEFELVLPVAEFHSPDGKNMNKTVIEPDMTTSGEDALQFLLKTL